VVHATPRPAPLSKVFWISTLPRLACISGWDPISYSQRDRIYYNPFLQLSILFPPKWLDFLQPPIDFLLKWLDFSQQKVIEMLYL